MAKEDRSIQIARSQQPQEKIFRSDLKKVVMEWVAEEAESNLGEGEIRNNIQVQ